MMDSSDFYIYAITALLPLASLMLVLQTNPYHALVIRGVLGAIAALVYTVLGAADVALTEALVGTLLAIALYAIAVRSSLVLRLGVLKDDASNTENPVFNQLLDDLRSIFKKYHMQVEVMPYSDFESLQQALIEKEVHAIADRTEDSNYQTVTRLPRIYEIIASEQISTKTLLANYSDFKEARS